MASANKSVERERLLKLLAEGKISEADFKMLSEALAPSMKRDWVALLFNPFESVAGGRAVAYAVGVAVLLSLLGAEPGIHFPGLLDLQIPQKLEHDFVGRLLVLLGHNFAALFVLGILGYLSALVGKRRGVRFVDFLGMLGLARFAYVPCTALLLGFSFADRAAFYEQQGHPVMGYATALVAVPSLVWLFVTYFSAYREASGFKGRALWIGYVFVIAVGELAAALLTRWIGMP